MNRLGNWISGKSQTPFYARREFNIKKQVQKATAYVCGLGQFIFHINGQKVSDHELSIFGLTQCHKKCAKVYLSLFLERKVNGSYGTYKIFEYTAKNVTSLSKEIKVLVPSGTYYRVRGYHAASNGGLKESTSTLTSGIMIK